MLLENFFIARRSQSTPLIYSHYSILLPETGSYLATVGSAPKYYNSRLIEGTRDLAPDCLPSRPPTTMPRLSMKVLFNLAIAIYVIRIQLCVKDTYEKIFSMLYGCFCLY